MIDPYQDITFNAGFGMKTTLQSVVDAGLLSAPEVRLTLENVNSQAPDVPELAHQGVFQLSRLSINCYVKTTKKCSLYLSRTDFLKILSVPQDHCGSHNNFLKIFSKNYTLYGVYIFLNFGICLNPLAFNDTKTHFYKS